MTDTFPADWSFKVHIPDMASDNTGAVSVIAGFSGGYGKAYASMWT